MRPRKIFNFDEGEKQELIRMYVSEKMTLNEIYVKRYKGVISERTFFRYVKRYTPNISKFKSVR